MKTTIYELLGMIKDGKAPKKIMYEGCTYVWNEYEKDYERTDINDYLFDNSIATDILNDEVIILETTITYKQDDYIQYQPYTGEVEIKCNSAKNLLESNKIEKVDTYVLCDSDFHTRYKDGYSLKATEIIDKAFEEYSYTINEIINKVNKND